MLSWLPFVIAAVVPAPVVVVDGAVVDAVHVHMGKDGARDEVWASVQGTPRRLVRIDVDSGKSRPGPVVPAGAVFFDVCTLHDVDHVVWADATGLSDESGTRLLTGQALFTVPDPDALLVGDLCGKSSATVDELRLPVVDGIAVQARDAHEPRTLVREQGARAFSGRVQRGLRPDRGYAFALSLYAPRLVDVDVDGDGDLDLVAVRDGHLSVWLRKGTAFPQPAREIELGTLVHAGDDADLRVRFVPGAHGSDVVVGVTRGALPERSEAWRVTSTATAPFSQARLLWKREGLAAPLEVRPDVPALVIADVDTSLVSLSTVLLTGRVAVRVTLQQDERVLDAGALSLPSQIDVRAGRMAGGLPVTSIDFDGDGVLDLLDVGEAGRAALHLGTKSGYASDAVTTWSVPAFVRVVPLPRLHAVVLVGAVEKGKSKLAILRLPPR
jgi:hypothetical protein